MLSALEIIWKQSNNPGFQIMVSELKNKLSQGGSLSSAFNELPHVFPYIYRALIGVAETGVNLVTVLDNLLKYYNTQKMFTYKMKKAITYPLIVLVFSCFVVLLMLLWVVPTFQTIFTKVRVELPFLTLMILKISAMFRSPYFWLAAALISV